MQKSAFERTGLVPRSIIRTFDRFRRQLLPGAEDLVIQEFRVSKYQVLVSVRCLASLLFFPLLVNYLVKTTILIPLAEYIWNTQQNEIFLNFYQENRAFLEMRDFEEKTFFESLVSAKPRQSDYNTLVSHKTKNDFELIPIKSKFSQSENQVLLRKTSKMTNFNPCFASSCEAIKRKFSNEQIDFSKKISNLSKIFREKSTSTKNKIENLVDSPEIPKICLSKSVLAPNLLLETFNFQNSTKNCTSENRTFNSIPNLKENLLNLPKKKKISEFFLTELKEISSKNINSKKLNLVNVAATSIPDRDEQFFSLTKEDMFLYQQNVDLRPKSNKVLSHFSVKDPFFVENKKEITQSYGGSATIFGPSGKHGVADTIAAGHDSTFYETKCKEDPIFQKDQNLMSKYILPRQLCKKYEIFDGANIDFGNQKEETTFFLPTKKNLLPKFLQSKNQGFVKVYFPSSGKQGIQNADFSQSEKQGLEKAFFRRSRKQDSLDSVLQNISESFENKKTTKIDEILLQKKFQEKTIQLAAFYNQQTISAIANVFGDFVTLITIAFLFVLMKPQIIILKSFLTESIYSLSDTTKSFLLILLTDLLVGFHSPRGWEILIEILLRHFGLPENQDFVFLFVATLPVLLDTVFKYWIFRYLNQISPSTVATYHSMIE